MRTWFGIIGTALSLTCSWASANCEQVFDDQRPRDTFLHDIFLVDVWERWRQPMRVVYRPQPEQLLRLSDISSEYRVSHESVTALFYRIEMTLRTSVLRNMYGHDRITASIYILEEALRQSSARGMQARMNVDTFMFMIRDLHTALIITTAGASSGKRATFFSPLSVAQLIRISRVMLRKNLTVEEMKDAFIQRIETLKALNLKYFDNETITLALENL